MKAYTLSLLCAAAIACGGGQKPANDATEGSSGESSSSGGDTTGSSSSGGDTTGSSSSSSSSSGGTAPKEGGSRSQNTYDKENTDMVLTRAARQVKANCGAAKDDQGKATGPWGKVNIKVTLGHNGHTKAVSVPPPLDEKPAGKCISNAFAILVFPPWAGQDTDVDWEVELVKPEEPVKDPKGKK
ncbi:MAG: hypothetical protein HOO96_01685 [Polyangiaceae bacterium]|nr:hypothetical protein [Polyangiaceae bacterium]